MITKERAKELLQLLILDPKDGSGITNEERNELWHYYNTNIKTFTLNTSFFYILKLIVGGQLC